MKKSTILLVVILYMTGVAAHAQSLGDLAREEQKRREAVSDKITIIDNAPSVAVTSTTAPGMETLTDEEFDKLMVEVANEINKTLPRMLDSETRLDTFVSLPNKTLMYVYTNVKYSIDDFGLGKKETENYMRSFLLNYIKTSSDSEIFRDHKATFAFTYKDKNGHEWFTLSFDYDDYK